MFMLQKRFLTLVGLTMGLVVGCGRSATTDTKSSPPDRPQVSVQSKPAEDAEMQIADVDDPVAAFNQANAIAAEQPLATQNSDSTANVDLYIGEFQIIHEGAKPDATPAQRAAIDVIAMTGGRVYYTKTSESAAEVMHVAFGSRAIDADFDALRELPNAVDVYIRPAAPITDACMARIAGLSKLTRLDFGGQNAYQQHWLDIGGRVPLAELPRASITNAGLKYLSQLKSLEVLDLMLTRITDEGLANLKGLTSLRELHLSVNDIADEGLEHLAGLTRLETLTLHDTRVRGAGFAHFARLQKLRLLYLWATEVDDSAMPHLGRLLALETLSLTHTRVTDAGLPALEKLPLLTDPGTEETQVTAEGLRAWRARRLNNPTTRLVEMIHEKHGWVRHDMDAPGHPPIAVSGGLSESKFDDSTLAELGRHKTLRELHLSRSKVTDNGLTHLADLKNLESIDLEETNVTNDGLKHLAKFGNLKTLNLRKTRVDFTRVLDLQEALPRCKILF